jgi:AraC family transcriptional regulator
MQLQAGEFLGSAVRVHEWGGFTLSEHAYPANARLPNHEHRYAYLSIPVSGSYEERWGARRTSCSSATAVFHPRGEQHADFFHGASSRVLSIEIDDVWHEHLREAGTRMDERIELRAPSVLRGAARLRRMLRLREAPSLLKIEACTIDLLAELPARREERRAPRWLRTVVESIHDAQPARPPMSALARGAGVHPVHLSRTFRRVHGCTIGEYVRGLRIERAMELLRGHDPIGEVAIEAGFSDQSHLCRELKRAIGVTPRAFRTGR